MLTGGEFGPSLRRARRSAPSPSSLRAARDGLDHEFVGWEAFVPVLLREVGFRRRRRGGGGGGAFGIRSPDLVPIPVVLSSDGAGEVVELLFLLCFGSGGVKFGGCTDAALHRGFGFSLRLLRRGVVGACVPVLLLLEGRRRSAVIRLPELGPFPGGALGCACELRLLVRCFGSMRWRRRVPVAGWWLRGWWWCGGGCCPFLPVLVGSGDRPGDSGARGGSPAVADNCQSNPADAGGYCSSQSSSERWCSCCLRFGVWWLRPATVELGLTSWKLGFGRPGASVVFIVVRDVSFVSFPVCLLVHVLVFVLFFVLL